MNNTTVARKKVAKTESGIPAGMIPITNDPMNPGGYRDPNSGQDFNYKGQQAWYNLDDGTRRYVIPVNQPTAMAQSGAPVGSGVGSNVLSGGSGPVGNTGVVGNVNMPGGVSPSSFQRAGGGGQQQQMPVNTGREPMPSTLPFAISERPVVDVGNVRAQAVAQPAQMPMSPAAPAITPEQWMAISNAPVLPAPPQPIMRTGFPLPPQPYIDPVTGYPVAAYPGGQANPPAAISSSMQSGATFPVFMSE